MLSGPPVLSRECSLIRPGLFFPETSFLVLYSSWILVPHSRIFLTISEEDIGNILILAARQLSKTSTFPVESSGPRSLYTFQYIWGSLDPCWSFFLVDVYSYSSLPLTLQTTILPKSRSSLSTLFYLPKPLPPPVSGHHCFSFLQHFFTSCYPALLKPTELIMGFSYRSSSFPEPVSISLLHFCYKKHHSRLSGLKQHLSP